jgi:RNA polymerase sigma-70 factor (sigma-E family)
VRLVGVSFDEFAAARLPELLRYAVMLTGDPHLAQDVVQEVLVRAHGRWRRIAATSRPELYVRRMVTNEYLSWRRRWSTRRMVLMDPPELAESGDHAALAADRDDLWSRLATLPRRQRAVLVLRYYEGLSDADIAAVLGCAAGTVRGYAARALAALRLQFAEPPAPAPQENR